ncbi:MAG: M14 family zinc carboxypeptidase [Saprospiraceae bacterium]
MMRHLFIFAILLISASCRNQTLPDASSDGEPHPLLIRQRLNEAEKHYQQFYNSYTTFKEASIKTRKFKHADIVPLIQRLQDPFKVSKAGESMEGRAIYRVSIGTGATQVFLWSQMHGDESTATMAIMDLFNFFSRSGDEFDEYRQKILSNMTLTFIPMLNPDGAERWQRRNVLGVDLNRDALRLQCPESQILKKVRDELNADWGFNLHDQGRYYVGDQKVKIATFSFLAPAFNVEKEVNEKRGDAMQLIGLMNKILQPYIPAKIGRYDDTFEPRAFGDNIQKWGTRTILIECGLNENDPEKQTIRRLHYMLLLAAFEAIADKSYEQTDFAAYNAIPFNDNVGVFDLIVRGAQVQHDGKWYTMDLGYKRDDTWLQYGYASKPSITEFGDMSIFSAYDEIDANGYRAVPGKVYPTVLQNIAALKELDIPLILAQGYTDVRLREFPDTKKPFPLNLLKASESPDNAIRLWGNPNFVLQRNGETGFAVVNGFGYDLRNDQSFVRQLVKDF